MTQTRGSNTPAYERHALQQVPVLCFCCLCQRSLHQPPTLLQLCVRLCCLQGLSYLHSKAVTHFDLKTANLLFTIKVSQLEPGRSSS
jgi:serine/threonine protein kinase